MKKSTKVGDVEKNKKSVKIGIASKKERSIKAETIDKKEKSVEEKNANRNEKTLQIELGLNTQLKEKHAPEVVLDPHNTLKSVNHIRPNPPSEYKSLSELTQAGNHPKSDSTSEYKSPSELTQAGNHPKSDFTSEYKSPSELTQADNHPKSDFTSEYKSPQKLTQTDNHTKSDFTSEYKNPRKITNTNSLYLAIFKLIRYLYTLIKNFPKEYKYTLGEDIIKLAWATLDCVASANILPNNEKKAYILKASLTFDKLKFRLRLSHELKLVSNKQEAYLIEQNTQINKMLTGWMKWSERPAVKQHSFSPLGQP